MGRSKDLATGETRFVNTAGDTMTGALTVGGPITVNPDADSSLLLKSGGTNAMFLTANTGDELYIGANNEYAFRIKNDGTKDVAFDNGGRVTMPSQPSFLVRGNTGGWVTVISNNETNVAFGNAVFNVGGNFSTSTNRFTAPIAGKYLIHFHCYLRLGNYNDDNEYATTRIYKNGSVYENYHVITGYNNNGDADQISPITAIVDMAVNDYVTAGVKANDGNAQFYQPNCNFTGYLIG